jgi:hypothetical protein
MKSALEKAKPDAILSESEVRKAVTINPAALNARSL